MKKNNTIDEKRYYIYNIGIAAAMFYLYYSYFYIILDGFTRKESGVIFVLMYVIPLAIGIMINVENRRNKISIFLNNIIPVEIITIVFYFDKFKFWIFGLLIVSISLTIEYGAHLIKRKIRKCPPHIKNKVIKNRIKAFLLYSKNIFGFIFLMLLVVLFVSNIVVPVFLPLVDGQKATNPNEEVYSDWKTEAHYDDIAILFDENQWTKCSLKEKSRILQTVCNIEANFLGLNHEINFQISNENHLSGSYNEKTNTVIVYELDKKTGEEALSTVLHECHHAMQHRIVEVYDELDYDVQKLYYFYNAFLYKEEFQNYSNSRTDENEELFEYYFQQCEIDARNYSESKIIYYKSQIDEYKNEMTD